MVGAENYTCKFIVNMAKLSISFLNKLKRREHKKRNPFNPFDKQFKARKPFIES